MKNEFHAKLLSTMADVHEPRFNRAHETLFKLVFEADEILDDIALGNRMLTEKEWDSLSMVCDALISYAKVHFVDEENHLFKCGYPSAVQHMEIHNQLIEQLNEFQKKITERNERDLKNLRRWLLEWLLNHINREDYAFALFLQQITVPRYRDTMISRESL
ncbi:MAG: hemerythrin family protein [Magnetococcales bacterium]|nr:hemerythrin family protein [Magnetococcales bacterium]